VTERHRRAASLGGLNAAANLTPDERVERARVAGQASAAKRKAAREAAGLPEPRRNRRLEPLPDPNDLEAYREAIRDERQRNGEVPLSYDAELRESVLRMRRDIAQDVWNAFRKGEASK
jgi:hypothetical protein